MIVFAGPSLPPEARKDFSGIDWRPPAEAGHLAALLDAPPEKICLIDGRFDCRPAPFHKEILALMARGTTIFGASSIGALRAAELDRHGMIGVGAIYHAYRTGLLTGDDEVALVHGNERISWKAISVPMVDVRATLCRAARVRLIDLAFARALRACWHEIHFVDRDWPLMIEAASGLADSEMLQQIAALHVPLKQTDAIACIKTAMLAPGLPPMPAPPDTIFFRRLRAEISR